MNTILTGDCLQVMPTLPENSVDSIITDPPYGLDFMGKSWDHGVPGVEFWQAALRVAKPGAILMAFGGTRTYHRLTCAIEDAGWEIRDGMCYLYGSGFPKSLDIGKQIDKRGGVTADFALFRDDVLQAMTDHDVSRGQLQIALGNFMCSHYLTQASQPAIPNWRDYQIIRNAVGLGSKWDSAFAAEAEREVVGKAPWATLNCAPMPGADCSKENRSVKDITAPSTPAAHLWQGWGTALKPAWEPIIVAMKPLEGTYAENAQKWGVAGLNIDGGRIGTDEDCGRKLSYAPSSIYAQDEYTRAMGRGGAGNPAGRWPANLLLDEEAARLLDEQSGESKSPAPYNPTVDCSHNVFFTEGFEARHGGEHGDHGGASRFFYTAKASSSERNAGLEGERSDHPTVKPVSLMRYLCKLTRTPTGGVVLDPFMGSGTTGVACILEHRDFIGIEIDEGYAEIARKRIADMTGPLFVTA